jgi:hypothetical protein
MYDVCGFLEGGAFFDISHEVTLELANSTELPNESYTSHGLFMISAPQETNNLPEWYMVENLGTSLNDEFLFLSASIAKNSHIIITKGWTKHTFSEVEVMSDIEWFSTRPFTDASLLWQAAREVVKLTKCDVDKVFLVVNVVPLKVLHFLPKWLAQ